MKKFLPIIVILLGVGGYFIWRHFFAAPAVPPSIIALSGRIEGDDSSISPKTAGRIIEVRYREGDRVKAGDTIAVLDDAQIRAREEQAQAALDAANSRVKTARDQIAVYQQQIQQNNLEEEQAKVDAQGRVSQAQSDVAAAEAGLGIAQIPAFVLKEAMERGSLELVLGDWFPEPGPLNVVYPENRHLSSKIRVFVDWIAELFSEHDGIQLRSTLRKP